jgi:hypothetical protein
MPDIHRSGMDRFRRSCDESQHPRQDPGPAAGVWRDGLRRRGGSALWRGRLRGGDGWFRRNLVFSRDGFADIAIVRDAIVEQVVEVRRLPNRI